jgi:hypothetical protein
MPATLFVITFGLFYQPGVVEAVALTMEDAEQHLEKEGYCKSKEEKGLWEKRERRKGMGDWWATVREVDLV